MSVYVCVLYRNAPPQSKFFSIKCSPNVHYKITPQARDRNADSYPLTPNAVLIVTMDSVSKTANDSKVPAIHPQNIFTLRANTERICGIFRIWRKILWNRFKQDQMFETEPDN